MHAHSYGSYCWRLIDVHDEDSKLDGFEESTSTLVRSSDNDIVLNTGLVIQRLGNENLGATNRVVALANVTELA